MRRLLVIGLLFGLAVLAVGVLSVSASDSVPYGVIACTSGSAPHPGWVFCNTTNAGLYTGCPDLTGRFVLDYQSGTYAVGATGGASTQTLAIANMPSHSHSLPSTIITSVSSTSGSYNVLAGAISLVTLVTPTSDTNTRSQGSGTAFSILPPYYVLAYEMKVGNYSVITDSTDDGCIEKNDAVYSVAHNSATGTIIGDELFIGQWLFGGSSVIDRSAVFFDTSSIPANAVINSATMKLTLESDSSTQDFNVVVQNGQPTYPHKPLVVGDYLYTQYSGNGGAVNTSTLPAFGNPFYISLNTSGLSWINKGGWTKFMLRSSRDIASSVPATDQFISAYSAETVTASYRPQLAVCYTLQNTSLTIYKNVVNATGTNQSNYSPVSGWKVWVNYTGNTTPIHTSDTKKNVTGSVSYSLNGTGYWVTSTHESTLNQIMHLVNATGTHQKAWTGTTWNDWMNATGNTTAIHTSDTKNNVTGTLSYTLNGTGYWITSSHESKINLLSHIINASGTHVGAWTGSIWNIWANYTGNATTVNLHEAIINASGTHVQVDRGSGVVDVYANYTGNTTPLHQSSVIMNASGSHSYTLNNTGYWDIASYTGNTTPIHTSDTKKNVSGSVSYSLNGTGYWVNSTHESILTQFMNLINATGTHQNAWDGSQWLDWANVTGNTTTCGNTSLNIITNIINATGSNQSSYNPLSGWTVWVNYTGTQTPLHRFFNIINATGTHDIIINSTGYWEWMNYTGNTTALHLLENIVNATGTHQYILNNTGYWVWANYTGNGSACGNTSLTVIEHLVNASGSYYSVYNSVSGWAVQNNYTGNTTPISIVDTKNNVTGSTTYTLDGSGYHVSSSHESIVHMFENLVNVTGTHQKHWTGLFWNVYANYSGNGSAPTPIHLYQNYLNATGTHQYVLNGTGYQVWANVTGNTSVPVTKIMPVGSTGAVYKLPLMVGMITSLPGLLMVKRRRRKNQY